MSEETKKEKKVKFKCHTCMNFYKYGLYQNKPEIFEGFTQAFEHVYHTYKANDEPVHDIVAFIEEENEQETKIQSQEKEIPKEA